MDVKYCFGRNKGEIEVVFLEVGWIRGIVLMNYALSGRLKNPANLNTKNKSYYSGNRVDQQLLLLAHFTEK